MFSQVTSLSIGGTGSDERDCGSVDPDVVIAGVNSTILVFGSNFGLGGRTRVTIAGVAALIVKSESSHTQLAVRTPYCVGVVAVSVAGVAAAPVAYNYR